MSVERAPNVRRRMISTGNEKATGEKRVLVIYVEDEDAHTSTKMDDGNQGCLADYLVGTYSTASSRTSVKS